MTLYSSLDETQLADSQIISTYAIENTQYQSPVLQTLGWGYSTKEYHFEPPAVSDLSYGFYSDYPFVTPSEDIQGLIVSAFLSFDDPLHQYEVPIKLTRISKNESGVYTVRFTDSQDRVVFDSSDYTYNTRSIAVEGATYEEKATNQRGYCVYKHFDWGDPQYNPTLYELLYWETELITLRMTVRRTTLDQYVLYPQQAILDTRAIYKYPERVRSITVVNRDPITREPVITGVVSGYNVDYREGYNISLESEDSSDIRRATIVTFSAVPGSGMGVAPNPDSNTGKLKPPIKTINGVKPINGAFYIRGDAGHTIRGTADISLGNDNRPCCDCADMSELGRLLNTVEDKYYCIGGKYTVAANEYIREISKLNERVEREAGESISYDYAMVEGNRLFAPFKLVYRNLLPFSIKNLRIRVRLEHAAILKEKTTQTGPVAKDYSDCYVIDELPELSVVEEKEHEEDEEYTYYTVSWKRPIGPSQQVYLRGFYRLNTHFQEYRSGIEQIKYTTCENETITVDLKRYVCPTCENPKYIEFLDFKKEHPDTDIEETARYICPECFTQFEFNQTKVLPAEIQYLNYGPWDHMEFMDFTGLLTNKELDYLEDEIRERCRSKGLDLGFKRNTINSKDEEEEENRSYASTDI